MQRLRDAIDFAEIEHDFVPLRKWANEGEQAGRELEVMDGHLNLPIGQEVLMATLQTVVSGTVSPEDTLRHLRY